MRSETSQDIRLAVVMTGGASLAVWMGGVATEINLATGAARPDASGPDASGPDPTDLDPAGLDPTDPDPADPDDKDPDDKDTGRKNTGPVHPADAVLNPADAALAARYARLTAILDVTLDIDVLSGASAGGINAAMLGFAHARRASLGPLRDLWLSLGSLDRLMRTPVDSAFPSLLRGDAVVLPALHTGLRAVAATGPPSHPGHRPEPTEVTKATAVFITTTIMRGELAEHTDSLGGSMYDVDYRGLFVFGTPDLTGPAAIPRLALAARASSAFPGAFEPAFVPVGRDVDDSHPDMARYVNSARGFHASDGGILVNRPIGPALAAIFDRPAHRQVRRVLTYIVPSPRPTDVAPDGTRTIPSWDRADRTPPVSTTLLGALNAALNQSIGTDLAALRAHNDAVRGTRATRRRLLRLSPAGAVRLADDDLYDSYRRGVAERVATPVVEALLRVLADRADLPRPPDADVVRTDTTARTSLTNAALDAAFTSLPERLPGPDDVDELWRLGQSTLDGIKGILLSMINEGYVLCPARPERARLARLAATIHAATRTATPDAGGSATLYSSSPRPGVFTTVTATLGAKPGATASEVAAEATRRWLCGDPAAAAAVGSGRLAGAWSALGEVILAVRTEFTDLVPRWTPTDQPPTGIRVRVAGLTVGQRRALAARTLADFVAYLPPTRPHAMIALLDLHLVEQESTGTVLDQPVELVQLSADLPTELDPARRWAQDKLTGLRLGNFAAFAKSSWRANDWMWGRLDGAGWLVRILLDPRRLILLRDLALGTPPPSAPDGPPSTGGACLAGARSDGAARERSGAGHPAVDAASWLAGLVDALAEVAGTPTPAQVQDELAVLADLTAPVPLGLPATALWVAGGFQRDIAAQELVGLARAVREDIADGITPRPTAGFLAAVDAALADIDDEPNASNLPGAASGPAPESRPVVLPATAVSDVLRACTVPDERITDSTQSPILVTELARIGAVLASWLASAPFLPRPVRPVAFLIRTAARIGSELVRDLAQRRRLVVIVLGLPLLVLGAVGALVGSGSVGALGIVAGLLGLVVVGVPDWRRLPGGLAVAGAGTLVLLAAAGVIPVLHDRLFDWLREDAVPYLADHPYAWALVFLALVAPGGWSLADVLLARRVRRRDRQRHPARNAEAQQARDPHRT
ncbi:patatin-like protein [Frankia sp. AiPa1]|nr:patatin-like protein [Frankia sp. AiPa1]